MPPILSIIIPTRNRAEYAKSAIKSILKNESKQFELIIQDNSDNEDLKNYLRSNVFDYRLRYSHTKIKLDYIANFSKALDLATGEYFAFIGDDDGVNPEIVEAALWMKENEIDALTPFQIADYMWPDMRVRYYNDRFAAMLRIKNFTGVIAQIDPEKGMIECAEKAFQNLVYNVQLPKIYYGIVRRHCMNEVFQKANTYFPGVSPDMAGAMAVASYVKKMCSIDYPLFISGSSANSAAGLSAQKRHHGRLEDQPHLPVGCWDHWPGNVPKFFSVQTVWAQSGVRALDALDRHDILKKYNVPLLHASCAAFNPHFFAFTIRSFIKTLRIDNESVTVGLLKFSSHYMKIWGWRAKLFILRIFSKYQPATVTNIIKINDIDEAAIALSSHLRGSGQTLQAILKPIQFN